MSLDNNQTWNTQELDLTKKSKQLSSQILLEGDGIVPENKPDLSNIIHFSGEIYEKSIKVSDNQFNYIAELTLDILYYCNNSTYGIYSMKTVIPINEILYLDDLNSNNDIKIKVNCKIAHLECNMVNDRKINIKCVADLSFYSEENYKQKIISPNNSYDSKIEFLEEVINIEKMIDSKKDHYKVKEEMIIDDKTPSIGEILKIRCKIIDKEIRSAEEKAMIHCNIIVDTLYRDNEGLCHICRSKIPFHTYMESKVISPQSNIDMTLNIKQSKVDVCINDDGEARVLEIELDIEAYMQAFSNDEFVLITDAYIPNKSTNVVKEPFSYTVPIGVAENQFHIRDKITINDDLPSMMQVENTWADVIVENINTENDIIEVNGILKSETIYLSGEDNSPLHIFEENIPFSQRIELKDINPNDDLYVTANVEEVDFQIYSGREGELISRILLEVVGKRTISSEAIVNIEIEDSIADNSRSAGAVIYTVQNDDNLWNIAKTHNTTVSDIVNMNGIEKVNIGDSVLIFRS